MDPGSVIDGFRIERRLGSGSLGTVYEATQLSLGRTVALRLLDQRLFSNPEFADRFRRQQRLSATVHHPAIVPTYEAGDWSEGKFVATRYVHGRTLADLLEADSLSPRRLRGMLEPIAGALDAAHGAGLVHGRVSARNVLVNDAGDAHLADLGLGRSGSADDDCEALAALAAPTGPRGGRGRRRLAAPALAGLAALVVAATIVLVARGAGGGKADQLPPPRIAAGTIPIGSRLVPGPSRGLGCSSVPGPNTPACTLSQSTIAGRSMTVREGGLLRGWAVRGAAGDLALQVIAHRHGHDFLRGFSPPVRVPDPGPHSFAADVPVARGDRIGVVLAPGAVIGARAARAGTSALRWEGTLEFQPGPQSSSRIHKELLLRADIDLGARPDLPPQRTGRRAAAAVAGHPLGRQVIDLPRGRVVRVELVRVGDRIAIDALRDGQRLARIDVPDARPGGQLLDLNGNCGYRRGFCLRWLNEGEVAPVVHAYGLGRDGSVFRLIG